MTLKYQWRFPQKKKIQFYWILLVKKNLHLLYLYTCRCVLYQWVAFDMSIFHCICIYLYVEIFTIHFYGNQTVQLPHDFYSVSIFFLYLSISIFIHCLDNFFGIGDGMNTYIIEHTSYIDDGLVHGGYCGLAATSPTLSTHKIYHYSIPTHIFIATSSGILLSSMSSWCACFHHLSYFK